MDRIFIMYVAGMDLWTYGFWVVEKISILYVAGGMNLWTCGLWVLDRISITYVAGSVDLWTCGPVGCGQNIYHVCGRRCGPEDLWVVGCGQKIYVVLGVDRRRRGRST